MPSRGYNGNPHIAAVKYCHLLYHWIQIIVGVVLTLTDLNISDTLSNTAGKKQIGQILVLLSLTKARESCFL